MANRPNDIDLENLDKAEVVNNPAGIDFDNLDKVTIIAREGEQGYGTAIKTGLVGGFGSAIKLIDDTVRNEGKPSYKTDAEWREATKNPISDFIQEWGSDLENSNRVQFESMSGESIAQGVASSIPYIGAMAPVGAAAMKSKSIQPFRVAGITLASKAGLGSKGMLAAGEAMAALAASTPVNIVNSSLEGQDAYNEAIEEGKSENEAQSIKTAVAGLNFLFGVVTETAQFMSIFGQVSELLPKGAKAQLIAKFMGSTASEAVDEGVEQAIPDYVQGKPINKDEVLQSAVIGGASGLLFAGAGAGVDYLANKDTKSKTDQESDAPAQEEDAKPKLITEAPQENISPEMQRNRDVIAKYRDLLDLDLVDDEEQYIYLGDLLENGNDEEITDVANAIREATSQAEGAETVEAEVVEDEAEEIVGEVVEPFPESKPATEEEEDIVGEIVNPFLEAAAEEPAETPAPQEAPSEEVKAEEVKTDEAPVDEEYVKSRHQLAEDAKVGLEKVRAEGTEDWDAAYENITAPLNAAIANGKLKVEDANVIKKWVDSSLEKIRKEQAKKHPKTRFQQAVEQTATVKQQAKKQEAPVATESEQRDSDGFRKSIGDYEASAPVKKGEDERLYIHKENKSQKTLYANQNGTYTVKAVAPDKDGVESDVYESFNSRADAEAYIETNQKPKDHKVKTYKVSVRDSKNNIKVWTLGGTSKDKLKKQLQGAGYRVRVVSTPDKFDADVEKFNQRIETYKETRKKKKEEANKKLKAELSIVDGESENSSRIITEEERRNNIKLLKELAKMLRKVGINVYSDPQKLAQAARAGESNTSEGEVVIENNIVYLVDKDGERFQINGLANIETNTIYLNFFNFRTYAPVHEYTHIWSKILRETHPDVWAKGVELLKQTDKWNEIKAHKGYNLLPDDAIADEVLSWLAGENSVKVFDELSKKEGNKTLAGKLKAWLKEFWSELKSYFEWNSDADIESLTLEEFINMPLKDLISGENINKIKDKASLTATDNSRFAKFAPNRKLGVTERKLEIFLKNATRTEKQMFSSAKTKAKFIEVVESNPTLMYWDAPNGEHYYYVEYSVKKARKGYSVPAAIFKALKAVTGLEPVPYKQKSENVKDNMTPQEAILADTDIKEFIKDFLKKYPKYTEKAEGIEAALLNIDSETNKTFAELLREAAAKDLPEAGKELETDAYDEINYDLFEVSYGDVAGSQYYNYLINKYQTKTANQKMMLVPVDKKQETNPKVQELEKRLENGENRLAIFEETGWYKAKDGHWKYFIDDDLSKIDFSSVSGKDGLAAGKTATVGELYDNPELYEKFPYLKDIKVTIEEANDKKYGEYLPSSNEIKIYNNKGSEYFNEKRTLLHELEHAIQEHEGMAVGYEPEEIQNWFIKETDRLYKEAYAINSDAGSYIDALVVYEELSQKPFGEPASRSEIKQARKEMEEAESFLAGLDKDARAKVDAIAEMVRAIVKQLKDAGPSDISKYWNVLGEQEARLVERRAESKNLSSKDKGIVEEIKQMIAKMPNKLAAKSTNAIYMISDVGGIRGEEMEKADKALRKTAKGKALLERLQEADNPIAVANSLAYLDYVMGNDSRSIVIKGDGKSSSAGVNDDKISETKYSAVEGGPSVETRLRKAVKTVKPTTISEDITKAGGKKSWLQKQWRKFYRTWADKETDLNDLDDLLATVLGRALEADESIYTQVRMISSNSSGLINGLVEGGKKHIEALNSEMKHKQMEYTEATLSNVLDIVNAEKMNKEAPNYLAKFGEGYTWDEAFGTYLGWRRLAEMARLKREAYNQELIDWTVRKAAYDAWVAGGRIGKNPQQAAYEAWSNYQKAKKNAKRRWERAGKIGPDPTEALREEYLKTHKNEDAPIRYVGKQPEFKPYQMPENLTEQEVFKAIQDAPPAFAEAANLYYQLNDNILSIMEDAGLINAELHELLNSKYKEYCPMIRDFSDTAAVDAFLESITVGGKGIGNVSSMIQKIRAEGSERTIINPLESTLQTIAAVANRAERNKAGQHLVRMMTSSEDLKDVIVKLEQPRHGTINADPKNCIFTVMFNGKKEAYRSDPEYYQAIVGYNLPTSSMLLKIPQTVAKTLRTGSTMSPSFIVRNIFRDTITAGIASKNGFTPIIDTIRGAKALWSDAEFRAEFEAAGIVSFNQFGSAESAYRDIVNLSSGKNYSIYDYKKIIKGVLQAVFKGDIMEALKITGISFEQLSSFAESATRAGEYRLARKAGKSIRAAAFDAKEVTLDFSRSGIAGQQWNRYVPFFNACIQGGDTMIRLFYRDPKGTSLKVAQYILLPSLLLWALNYDEEWYKELDPSVKYTHWCLPNGIRVPKPQEYGVLFGGGVEAVLDQAANKDPRAMKEWADALRDAVSPSVLPAIVVPLFEWITNYSFFKGRDLVPKRLQRLPNELQYSTGTSELSKFIGKTTFSSPVKIDNLVRGYTGTMGMLLWRIPDLFAAEAQGLPAKHGSEMMFVRDFNVTPVIRNRYVNDFYELQEKANQHQAGYGTKGKPSGAVRAIRKVGQTINELNKQIRTIEVSDKYTPERKRELIDKKQEQIKKIAKQIVDKYGEDYL